MAIRHRRGATNVTSMLWVVAALIGFVVVAIWAVNANAQRIEDDIADRTRQALSGAPGVGLQAEVDGRDVTVRGRVDSGGAADVVTDRVAAVHGVRVVYNGLQVVPGLDQPAGEVPAPPPTATGDASGTGRGPSSGTTARGDLPALAQSRKADARSRPAAPRTSTRTTRTVRRKTKTAATKATRKSSRTRVARTDTVRFARGSAVLPAAGRAAAQAFARGSRSGTVHVYGHADDAGSAWGNHDLSVDRAEAVARALRAAGVPASRIRTHAAGDGFPVAARGSAANRRVELALHEATR